MKKVIAGCILGAAMFCSACTEEGFIKVFECDEDYPYFSALTHLCYKTDQDREDAEKQYAQEQEAETNQDAENGSDDTE